MHNPNKNTTFNYVLKMHLKKNKMTTINQRVKKKKREKKKVVLLRPVLIAKIPAQHSGICSISCIIAAGQLQSWFCVALRVKYNPTAGHISHLWSRSHIQQPTALQDTSGKRKREMREGESRRLVASEGFSSFHLMGGISNGSSFRKPNQRKSLWEIWYILS